MPGRSGAKGELPTWLSALVIGATFVTLTWLEHARPLRRRTEPAVRRAVRNLAVAAGSAAVVQLASVPVTRPLARLVERRRWGIVKRLGLPRWLEVPLALVLLDYSLYLWHVALHRVPLLWRAHQPHHVDLDLDTTTALRFHPAEMLLSVPLQAGQIVAIGVSPMALSVWGTWLLSSVLFHHSNVALPASLDRRLVRWIVTPRMHGVHHSIVPEETNSNWSSGLTLWDRLHGTLRLDVPQDAITIGVPAYRASADVTLGETLVMPFRRDLPDPWRLPDGRVPARDRDDLAGAHARLT